MSVSWMRGIVGVSIVALALSCAGLESWETERADPKFVDGTRVLAQVAVIYSRNEILTGNREFYSYVQNKTISGEPDAE